jgi:hypothetical protein
VPQHSRQNSIAWNFPLLIFLVCGNCSREGIGTSLKRSLVLEQLGPVYLTADSEATQLKLAITCQWNYLNVKNLKNQDIRVI